MLEGGLRRFLYGACSRYIIPKGNSTLLVPLVMRFFINGRDEWNSSSVEFKVEVE
jgi:hypothetical protein